MQPVLRPDGIKLGVTGRQREEKLRITRIGSNKILPFGGCRKSSADVQASPPTLRPTEGLLRHSLRFGTTVSRGVRDS